MARINLLIGNGEALTSPIPPKPLGPNSKSYPYSLERTRERLAPNLLKTIENLADLPADAKPGGEGVALVKVHPAFLAKSNLPSKVLRAAGLRTVGSRLVRFIPEWDARPKERGEIQPAAELYVAGPLDGFKTLLHLLMQSTVKSHRDELRRIENIEALSVEHRLGHINNGISQLALEVVLHGGENDEFLLQAFAQYVAICKGQTRIDKRLGCRGLIFLPVQIPLSGLASLAKFSLLRSIRSQPVLRIHRLGEKKKITRATLALPSEGPVSSTLKTAIFDGGLYTNEFSKWVSHTNANDVAENSEENEEFKVHGTAVTSAFLFGRTLEGMTVLPTPYTKVDHHQVIGAADSDHWYSLYEPLARIKKALTENAYDFVSLSIGPQIEIDDGHVHAWTTMVDQYLSERDSLFVVAAGNIPEDAPTCTRIQPPADSVNALAVGCANSDDMLWDAGQHSCVGPGRSPGLVKPDGVAFAGTTSTPIYLYGGKQNGLLEIGGGTSFAAPLTLRVAAGVKAATDYPLSAVALKALMIHHAERGSHHNADHVGWGRLPEDVETILLSTDNVATIIYQGSIESANRIRARIPLPDSLTEGHVHIKATFCFTSDIDPAHSINYTRSGLGITFRPRQDEEETIPFFSSGNLYDSEASLRNDAHKWETVLSCTKRFPALRLNNPIFDIEYQGRQHGLPIPKKDRKPLPYVLIVTVTVDPSIAIYNRILQKYPALTAIQLRESIQLRTDR